MEQMRMGWDKGTCNESGSFKKRGLVLAGRPSEKRGPEKAQEKK